MKNVPPQSRKTPARKQGHAAPDFAPHAEQVFNRLREAMEGLVKSLPQPINRAVDVQRALGVYAPLAWRIFRIAKAEEPLAVAEFVPTPGHITTLMEAAEKAKLPPRAINEVRGAMAAFEELRKAHAGNRERLRSMVASLRPTQTDLIDTKCRRAAFENNSLIWGVQTDVAVACSIMQATPDLAFRMAAGIAGRIGFHGVRPGASTSFVMSVSGDTATPGAQNVDRQHAVDAEILREFCSPSLMPTRVWEEDRWARTRITHKGIGRRSAVNYFQLMSNQEGSAEPVELDHRITCPSVNAHLDLLVPSAWKPSLASTAVYGHLTNLQAGYEHRSVDEIPLEVFGVDLGPMLDVPAAPGVPRYPEMVRKILDQRGWYGTEFNVFRCRVAYPILHAVIHMGVTLGVS